MRSIRPVKTFPPRKANVARAAEAEAVAEGQAVDANGSRGMGPTGKRPVLPTLPHRSRAQHLWMQWENRTRGGDLPLTPGPLRR